jgi:hypothetical protein
MGRAPGEQLGGAASAPPVTDDIDEARAWFEVLPAAMGGLVVKGTATRYTSGGTAGAK